MKKNLKGHPLAAKKLFSLSEIIQKDQFEKKVFSKNFLKINTVPKNFKWGPSLLSSLAVSS